MTFQSPWRLWVLLGVAALALAYLEMHRRRGQDATRFADPRSLPRIAAVRPAWRRHLPATLFLIMLASLGFGFARPADNVQIPRERATVIVAVDVSASMLADDVDPDRLAAARSAAIEFAEGLPEVFNVGLVAFAGSASVMVSPGTDREALRAGIERLGEENVSYPGTAIGEAVVVSLEAIRNLDAQAPADPPPARVILLSDGANTSGVAPDEAANDADEAGVPVDTISVGTLDGVVDLNGRAVHVPVDGESLRAVADRTGGGYHEAASSDELHDVYKDIGSSVGYRTERRDITVRFVGLGLFAAIGVAGTSLAWSSRLP